MINLIGMNDKPFFYKFYEDVTISDNYGNDHNNYNTHSMLVKDKDELKLMGSLLNKDKYVNSIPVEDFCSFLDILEISDDHKKKPVINMIMKNTNDPVQLNTLNRILKMKRWKKYKNSVRIQKKCPRCNYIATASEDTEYVICGYTEKRGYDRKGCGFDWCFKCGKKLCKCWELNNLFDKYNRFHDGNCCKTFANKYDNDKYPDNYCQCKNENVFRDRV